MGLLTSCFGETVAQFRQVLHKKVQELDHHAILADKPVVREKDEAKKPLNEYRREELEHMKLNFFGFDPSYHVARYKFVLREPKSHTPIYLAKHRQRVKNGT